MSPPRMPRNGLSFVHPCESVDRSGNATVGWSGLTMALAEHRSARGTVYTAMDAHPIPAACRREVCSSRTNLKSRDGRRSFQRRSSNGRVPGLHSPEVARSTRADAFSNVSCGSFAEGYPSHGLYASLTREIPTDGDAGPQTFACSIALLRAWAGYEARTRTRTTARKTL